MTKTIAWTRLTIYIGGSLVFLTEGYRLIAILLTLVIIAPPLMAMLQAVSHWFLLIGFTCLTLGFYRLLISDPPLLENNKFPLSDIKKSSLLSLMISIVLALLLFLPPSNAVDNSISLLNSVIISFMWVFYYTAIIFWLVNHKHLIGDIKNIKTIFDNKRLVFHVFLGVLIIIIWSCEFFTLLFFQTAIFSYDIFNLVYITLLVLFLLHQIYFFFNVTRFSYLIFG